MADTFAPAARLMIAIAEALWAARGLWAFLGVLLLWRLTLHTREVALYFRARRLAAEQRRLVTLATTLEDRLDDVGDDRKAHAALERQHRRIRQRLHALERVLSGASLDRAGAP